MTDRILEDLAAITGPTHVLTGKDAAPWSQDWADMYHWTPLAVVKPANTEEVAAIIRLANEAGVPVVPVSGNTGLVKGTNAEGAIMLSLARMSAIRDINPKGRTATVEAGVILSSLHEAVAEHDLIFPLTFGARGSAMIGGALSTNAGGSNVVRYGSTRGLCLGIEAVTPTGEVMNLMSALHKDNSGYDLRDLLIGAEGTLGVITAAVVKLFPKPRAYATAMVAAPDVTRGLELLHILQAETGGAVEAFEYMPGAYIDAHLKRFPDARPPFEERHEVNILVEVGALAARDAEPGPDGEVPIAAHLEDVLGRLYESGAVVDAVVAKSDAQRAEMWARREAAAEVSRLRDPIVDNDIAVPLDRMQELLERTKARARALDPGVDFLHVAHMGDGNLHFAAWPETTDTDIHRAMGEAVEEETIALGGSFSAEHGIGLSKLPAMGRYKDPVAMEVMRTIKRALDPNGIMNPGKVLP
ncbi:FAD-binding oxidoreductase [Roseovarius indicus]|uniref:FAD-dependent oxidoreductase n=1 Tax=Roseovarius indicus TaxID=540747 RepID=A0A0T5P9U0_9RHOB|nr:FAD-binding oxidoreductase [Roseovarius indicus]KRS17804.1 FAD-dependent oxidoreductase [Roseovarius indicus]QEW24677.1 putative FAD-linked oxidoreductase [Roseovarius indicus]SFE28332.1 FAD/FMN-containing dehydrogenase [Roseovarius indicus]